MTTIIRNSKGEVVSATDTGYHPDGTGPRDANGALLSSREPEGLPSAQVAEIKKSVIGAKDHNTTTAADSSAVTHSER